MVPIDLEEVPAQPYAGPRLDDRGPRVVFFGIPSDYGTAFLLHLIEKRINLVAVVCSTRWQRTHPKADLIARIAGYLGRPVEVTADANSEAFVRCLSAYEPDIVVMASFDQILTAPTLAVPTRGWLNVHPSLLPRHRGPEPIYWTIVNGDRDAGITVHQTVPRIDAGPILAQRRVAVYDEDTAGTLSKRLVTEGLGALDETLARLQEGRADAIRPQVDGGSYEPPARLDSTGTSPWSTSSGWCVPATRINPPSSPIGAGAATSTGSEGSGTVQAKALASFHRFRPGRCWRPFETASWRSAGGRWGTRTRFARSPSSSFPDANFPPPLGEGTVGRHRSVTDRIWLNSQRLAV